MTATSIEGKKERHGKERVGVENETRKRERERESTNLQHRRQIDHSCKQKKKKGR
jgi:hypothetical protein